MKSTMGYIIIVAGILLVFWGITLINKPKTKEINNVIIEPKAETTNSIFVENEQPVIDDTKSSANDKKQQDDFDENKAKGDAFEKYVVKNFDTHYFTLQEWRSDKYVDGIYAVSNHFPDLEVTFTFRKKNISETFAIECKWRKSYYRNGIEWAQDYQIKNYKEYADKLSIPVYVVIGVGGEPEKPNELFIVPLAEMNSNTISKSELRNYKKDLSDKKFFWDYENNKLK